MKDKLRNRTLLSFSKRRRRERFNIVSFCLHYYRIKLYLYMNSKSRNLGFDVVENDTRATRFSRFNNLLNVTCFSLSSCWCGFGSGDRNVLHTEGTTEVRHGLSKNFLLREKDLSVDRSFESDQSDTFLSERQKSQYEIEWKRK